MGGGAGGQRGDLAGCTRVPQRAQQSGHGVRVIQGGVGGGVAGQQRWPGPLRPLPQRPSRQATASGRRGRRGRRPSRPGAGRRGAGCAGW